MFSEENVPLKEYVNLEKYKIHIFSIIVRKKKRANLILQQSTDAKRGKILMFDHFRKKISEFFTNLNMVPNQIRQNFGTKESKKAVNRNR